MAHLTILARITAKKGFESEVAAAVQQLAIPTRMERGCVVYDIFQDPTNSSRILIYERWESHKHWRAHVETQHLQDFKNGILSSHAEMTVEKLTSAS